MPDLEIPDGLGLEEALNSSSASTIFTAENLIAWMLFGAIGFVAFMYGKKLGKIPPLVIGLLLMTYPYFVTDTWLLYGVGIVLTGALFVWKE